MKKLNTFATICIGLAFPFSAFAQKYKHLKNDERLSGQQAYMLPKAAFIIEVPIVKNTLSRGKSFINNFTANELQYLAERFGLDEAKYKLMVATPTKDFLEIADDSIKISATAVPDMSKIFYVDSKSKWNKNQSVTFNYGTDGVLTEGESSVEDKTFDIAVKIASGVTSVVAGAFPLTRGGGGADLSIENPKERAVKELEEALTALEGLEGQLNYDVYKDLKTKLEKRYRSIFEKYFYKEKERITIVKVVYTPVANTQLNTEIPFFRLNANSNLTFDYRIIKQLQGKDLSPGTVISGYTIAFIPCREQQKTYYNSRTDDKTGFAYNIPLRAEIKIKNSAKKTIYDEIHKIPQMGIVGFTNTKKEKLVFNLDPLTGELKKLTIEGKAITTDQIGNTATAVTEAVKAAKRDDEDTKLEKEVKRLENEKKKRELLKEAEQ